MSTTAPPSDASQSVVLRSFVDGDAPKLHVMSREPALQTWLPDQVYESKADALEVLRHLGEKCRDPGSPARAPYVLAVCLKASMELIGHVGLSPIEGQVEVGYAIEEKHHGKGFASEAVGAMVKWGLERFELPRILGIVAADNAASCRVLERADFELASESTGSLHNRAGLIRTYQRMRIAGKSIARHPGAAGDPVSRLGGPRT